MTAAMLGSQGTADDICGAVSSGGTESILLAMKTYRDWAKETKGITRPEIVIPATAHAAFDKAGEYFHIKVNHIPVDSDFRMDVQQVKKAITNNTIAVVGSAPSFPHGVIDPLEALAQIALDRHIGFHVDACLGGFVLPWAEKLGYSVPPFDFRLAGVTSMSADTHKFGYAAKGTSVVLYRGKDLRQFQYFTASDWPGGLYFSPTFAGSRPGALSAVCWAALLSMGENGYLQAVQCILETADTIKAGIKDIPGIHIQGDPLWVIAFASDTVDIYKVMDYMTKKQWNLNGLYKPPCVHICVTLRHAQPGVAEKFISDLQSAVQYVKEHPEEEGEMAPVYGLAANIPFRGVISDLLKQYMDLYYTP
jgi:glutamate/tyrosine decarboxylase-like PLP-dependent enzyme